MKNSVQKQGEDVVVTMRGKEIRLERIMNRNTKKTVIVPMDHGVSQRADRGPDRHGPGREPGRGRRGERGDRPRGARAARPSAGRAGRGADPAPVREHDAGAGPEREGARQHGAERPEDGGRRGLDAREHRGGVRGADARRTSGWSRSSAWNGACRSSR